MNATPTNDLRYLFDGTHCLSKRQMRDYAANSMSREEAFAVESHLNTCPLCSAAVDGMLAHFPESADVLATVDAGFLKDHFKKHSPQIHLNTVAPAATAPVTRRIPGSTRVIDLTSFRTVGIAAAILLLIGSLWWFQNRGDSVRQLADNAPIAQAEDRMVASTSGVPSSMPESEGESAQTAAAVATNEQAGAAEEPEKKKVADEVPVMADAAGGTVAAMAAMPPPSAPAATGGAAAAPVQIEMPTGNTAAEEDAAKLSSTQKLDDAMILARRYERPLIEPKQPASRPVQTDKEIEKMPTRNPQEAASTSPGVYESRSGAVVNISGGRSANTQYTVDGAMEDGKALYEKGSYTAALKVFRKQMNTSSGAKAQEATLYAARCYRALGKDAAAEKLLRALAENTGPRARAARRELRAMGENVSEEKAERSANDD